MGRPKEGTLSTRDVGWNGITAGGIAFVAAIVTAIFAAAEVGDDPILWIGLSLAFSAAGNLLGGVKTGSQSPLGAEQTTGTDRV